MSDAALALLPESSMDVGWRGRGDLRRRHVSSRCLRTSPEYP
jgi:hypothetical protein